MASRSVYTVSLKVGFMAVAVQVVSTNRLVCAYQLLSRLSSSPDILSITTSESSLIVVHSSGMGKYLHKIS